MTPALRAASRALIIANASRAIGHPVHWKEAKQWLDQAIAAGEIVGTPDASAEPPPSIVVVSR